MVRIRCHFDGKSLVPDEPVNLPEGQPLVALVEEQSLNALSDETNVVHKGEGRSFLEWIEKNAIDDPLLPSDGAYQHDHYLYGTPKKPGMFRKWYSRTLRSSLPSSAAPMPIVTAPFGGIAT